MEEHQWQQQQPLHSAIVDGIARLVNPRYRDKRHKLRVRGFYNNPHPSIDAA
jgi:hypothetical protein